MGKGQITNAKNSVKFYSGAVITAFAVVFICRLYPSSNSHAQLITEGNTQGSQTTPPTPTTLPLSTATPAPPPSFCDGQTVRNITLGYYNKQEHDHVQFEFKPNQLQYDAVRQRWYQNDKGASWVCAKNPNASALGTVGVNLVAAFSARRAKGVDPYDYVGLRESTLNPERAGAFFNFSEAQNANSCFICGLVRWNKGCFPHGVRITTGNGSTTKNIEDFAAGEKVWNPALKKGVRILHISEGPEQKDLVVLHAGSVTLRASTEHPMLTPKGFKQAVDIKAGEIVKNSAGNDLKISKVSREKTSSGLSVINFVLERHGSEYDGLMVADGLIVGDLIIQKKLASHHK